MLQPIIIGKWLTWVQCVASLIAYFYKSPSGSFETTTFPITPLRMKLSGAPTRTAVGVAGSLGAAAGGTYLFFSKHARVRRREVSQGWSFTVFWLQSRWNGSDLVFFLACILESLVYATPCSRDERDRYLGGLAATPVASVGEQMHVAVVTVWAMRHRSYSGYICGGTDACSCSNSVSYWNWNYCLP